MTRSYRLARPSTLAVVATLAAAAFAASSWADDEGSADPDTEHVVSDASTISTNIPYSPVDGSGLAPVPAPDPGGGVWVPEVGVSWQWQLSSETIDLSPDAQVYDVDGFEVDAATVALMHAMGRRVVCYLDAGAWEEYRSDAGAFPAEVIGNPVEGWPEERWLDVRRQDVLGPIMAARMDLCRLKGFDAVEADMVEAYDATDTGFDISAADQIAYNTMLAGLAHERGMSIGLKNAPELVPQLVDVFDFAVVEECYTYGECDAYLPFIERGKAVLHAEYSATLEEFCPVTRPLGFSSIRKTLDLGAWRQTCP